MSQYAIKQFVSSRIIIFLLEVALVEQIDPRVIVALDFDSLPDALNLAKQLDPRQCRLKVGKELFTLAGPQVVEALQKLGFEIFLDLKFHDIPVTVAKAVTAAAKLGVWMVNVHASGGRRMLEEVRRSVDNAVHKPLLIAVTVLTSIDHRDLEEVLGVPTSVHDHVSRLAKLTLDCGFDGVVCSAQEAPMLAEQCGKQFKLVTPGIRPVDSGTDDQRRIVSPAQALEMGSHYLVIGRPITQAQNPLVACNDIICSISDVVNE